MSLQRSARAHSSLLPLSSSRHALAYARTSPSHSRPGWNIRSQRFYAGGYGDGEGDPKGEAPQDQGPNPSASKEHPGPAPVAEGQESGAGATKGTQNGHDDSSSSGSSSNGAQPKIHDERAGPNLSKTKREDVERHNREFESRHDRAEARDEGSDKVHKGFWQGQGGADRDP